MTDEETGGPAFPHIPTHGSVDGMTLRQYAAIKLRVPDSGLDWLDDMIVQAKHDDFAGQALAGICADPSSCHLFESSFGAAKFCLEVADSMTTLVLGLGDE